MLRLARRFGAHENLAATVRERTVPCCLLFAVRHNVGLVLPIRLLCAAQQAADDDTDENPREVLSDVIPTENAVRNECLQKLHYERIADECIEPQHEFADVIAATELHQCRKDAEEHEVFPPRRRRVACDQPAKKPTRIGQQQERRRQHQADGERPKKVWSPAVHFSTPNV